MSWDGNIANRHFIDKYIAMNPAGLKHKPQNDFFKSMYDIELACQALYHLCATEAWTKERLTSTLNRVVNGSWPIHVPKGVNDPEEYEKVFKSEAKRILDDLETGTL